MGTQARLRLRKVYAWQVAAFALVACDAAEKKQAAAPFDERIAERSRPAGQLDTAGGRYHGLAGNRFIAATSALLPLLRTKASLGLRDFDIAIRELTRIACLGASDADLKVIETAAIEAIYPLANIGNCKAVKCGGCFTMDGREVPGGAFSALPIIDDARIHVDDAQQR